VPYLAKAYRSLMPKFESIPPLFPWRYGEPTEAYAGSQLRKIDRNVVCELLRNHGWQKIIKNEKTNKPDRLQVVGSCSFRVAEKIITCTAAPSDFDLFEGSGRSAFSRAILMLVYRLAYNGDVAADQLAVFQGASEAPISDSYGSSEQRRKTAN
jgi:hypothetical protein